MSDIGTVTTDYRDILDLKPDAIACPYPAFARLRDESPVEWVDDLGVFIVSKYEDIVDVTRRPDVFSSRLPTGPHRGEQFAQRLRELIAERGQEAQHLAEFYAANRTTALLSADPPLHIRQRKLVNRAFTPPRVKSMEDGMQQIANSLVDDFIHDGRVELNRQFGTPLPLQVIAQALGVPDGDLDEFKRWSDDSVVIVGNHNPSADDIMGMLRAYKAFAEYFTARIEQCRAHPRDDLISDIVTSEIDGEELSVPEMLTMLQQFLIAGNETTTTHIAFTMLKLCQNPDVMERVGADFSLIPNLIEESLRCENPAFGMYRIANVDAEVGDVRIPAGSALFLVYGSGSRDEAKYENPDGFDIDRQNARTHLAFGQGPHTCLGAPLARAESRIALETLVTRLKNIRLDPEYPELEYTHSYALRGLKELCLLFDPA